MQEEGASERQEQAQHVWGAARRLDPSARKGEGEDKLMGHGAMVENLDLFFF